MRYLDSSFMTEERWRGARYLLAGGLNTGLGLLMIVFFMYGLLLSPELANTLSYGIGIVTSYFLNRNLTFRSKGNWVGELSRFVLVYGLAFLVNLMVLWILVRRIEAHAFISQMVAMVVFVVTAYVLQSRFVFACKFKNK